MFELDFHYEGRNWRNQATYKVTDIRKRKRLEMERKAAEEAAEAALPQYRIVPTLNLRPVITRRARETVVTEAVSSSSDTRYDNIQTRSRIQSVNYGSSGSRDIDPVSSSSEHAECSRMHANYTRAKRVLKYVPMVEDSDTDDSD